MKKLLYILSVLVLFLSACQNEEMVSDGGGNDKKTLSFLMSIPEFQTSSRAIDETSISKIDLMVFDEKGLFVERVKATDVNSSARTFNAVVSSRARIIHFIANYSGLDNFDERANLEKSENQLIPALEVTDNELVFWGRAEISPGATRVSVEFIRNLAKVTVESEDTHFVIQGYSLCNYATNGTVSPFVNGKFEYSEDIPTIGTRLTMNNTATDANDMDTKYMCEYTNPTDNETYVILKATFWGGDPKYYKVLLADSNDNPYTIVRNVNYHIIVKHMAVDVGSDTFGEAKNGTPINNQYADVMKDSPSVSDDAGHSLTVTPLTHLFVDAGTMKSDISIEGDWGDVNYVVLSDENAILSNIHCTNTGITADVRKVDVRSSAQIRVKYGRLARTISVVASPEYFLDASTSLTSYSKADEEVTLTFTLDENYPDAATYPELYPIECHIKTDNLYPVDDAGKKMLIDFDYVKGEYWYTYLAESTGEHSLKFKTKLGSVDDVVKVESEYFTSRPASISLTGKSSMQSFTISKGALIASGNVDGKTISIYSDNAYTDEIGTCSFEWKSSTWRLSSDLTITCSDDVDELYFTYTGNTGYYKYKASMSIDNLKDAQNASGKRKTLSFN